MVPWCHSGAIVLLFYRKYVFPTGFPTGFPKGFPKGFQKGFPTNAPNSFPNTFHTACRGAPEPWQVAPLYVTMNAMMNIMMHVVMNDMMTAYHTCKRPTLVRDLHV